MSPRILGPGAFFPYDADFKDLRKIYDATSQVATIRNYGAKFGKGVAVEPGITNVETQSDFETQLRAWNPVDGDNAIGGTALTDGWRRYPKSGATTTNTQIYHQVTYSVTPGQRYTMQCLFRFDGSRPTFDLQFDYIGGTDAAVTPTVTHLGKGVWHAMATHVVPAGATSFRGLNLANFNWGSSTRIDLIEPVLFLHAGAHATLTAPIRTSHVWGTRSDGLLRYNGWLLPRSEGTVSCWIRPNYDYAAFENTWRDILRATTTASSDEFRLTIGANPGDSGVLQVRLWQGGTNHVALNYDLGPWDIGLLHHVAFSWSDAEQVLYYNGVRRASRVGQFPRWTETALVNVGVNAAGAELLDGLLDDLAIFPRQLTDVQVANIYA